MKFKSDVEEVSRLVNVKVNFNRCAPLAAKLDEPVALSNKLVSVSGVTIVSSTFKPIRTESFLELYLFIIIVWFATLTK